jgi:hypothetical protein
MEKGEALTSAFRGSENMMGVDFQRAFSDPLPAGQQAYPGGMPLGQSMICAEDG